MLMGCFYNTPNIILCILYNIRCTSLVYWDNYINYRRGFLFVVSALYIERRYFLFVTYLIISRYGKTQT